GRDTIVKFAGCYHGHVDSLLVKAGSGAATFDIPDSAGVPADFARHTLTLPLNDITALHRVPWNQVAAAIIEPIPANMGLIPLQPEFLGTLRALTRDHGALLIFDEVMSGFRVAPGGAQQLYGIQPDLTTLGKIIGGGLPVGAFGGRREIMDQLAPTGPVYQAGTLSGNPLAMAAGIATLEPLLDPPAAPAAPTPYQRLEQISAALLDELRKFLPAQCVRVGSMFCCFFAMQPVVDDRTARTCDTTRYARFFHAMLRRGVYLAPSQFEVGFLSLAHTPDDIEHTVRAARDAVKEL
ncbi:MAG: aminotransferase class III-fold pyridoxal phosphate-dependent enzyme, partial [Verrucomicrobiae bacterium]|nr:aminotransferase class III-fold pyridoxal phosphate-dependent enzyme [Verrucomicrobiae bacterium]